MPVNSILRSSMLFNCMYIVLTSLSLSVALHIILKKVDEFPGVDDFPAATEFPGMTVFSGVFESDKGAPGNTSNMSVSLYAYRSYGTKFISK